MICLSATNVAEAKSNTTTAVNKSAATAAGVKTARHDVYWNMETPDTAASTCPRQHVGSFVAAGAWGHSAADAANAFAALLAKAASRLIVALRRCSSDKTDGTVLCDGTVAMA